MRFRQAWILVQLVIEFFTWEAIWGASSLLRTIYCLRLFLLSIPLLASLILIQALVTWPSTRSRAQETGEEELIYRRELNLVQERNREIQSDLRKDVIEIKSDMRDLRDRQSKIENFQQRIEEKFDLGAKILGAICSVLVGQMISYLLNLRLRKELAKINRRDQSIQ